MQARVPGNSPGSDEGLDTKQAWEKCAAGTREQICNERQGMWGGRSVKQAGEKWDHICKKCQEQRDGRLHSVLRDKVHTCEECQGHR